MKAKLIGAVLATMALCALAGTASASAATPQWYVGGKALSGSATLAEGASAHITVSIPTLNTEVTCSHMELYKGSMLTSPSTLKLQGPELQRCKYAKPSGCTAGESDTAALPNLIAVLTKNAAPATSDGAILGRQSGSGPMFQFQSSGSQCFWAGEGLAFGTAALATALPKGQLEEGEQTFEISPEYTSEIAGAKVFVKGTFGLKLASGAKWSFR